jgi:hypothetical protein
VGLGDPAKYTGGANDGYATASGLLVLGARSACTACVGVLASVVPNPVADVATLRVSGRSALTDATLTLTDALGRTVRRQDHLRGLDLDINRAGLAPGIYLYQVMEKGEMVVYPGRFEIK